MDRLGPQTGCNDVLCDQIHSRQRHPTVQISQWVAQMWLYQHLASVQVDTQEGHQIRIIRDLNLVSASTLPPRGMDISAPLGRSGDQVTSLGAYLAHGERAMFIMMYGVTGCDQ